MIEKADIVVGAVFTKTRLDKQFHTPEHTNTVEITRVKGTSISYRFTKRSVANDAVLESRQVRDTLDESFMAVIQLYERVD